jgi:hypothetical protein
LIKSKVSKASTLWFHNIARVNHKLAPQVQQF